MNDLPFLLADAAARLAGRRFGLGCWPFLWILGALKCVQIMRRPEAHTLCVASLLMTCLGALVGQLGALILPSLGEGPDAIVVAITLAGLILFLWLGGLTLAVIGLIDLRGRAGEFEQGKGQAITTLVLTPILLVANVAAAAVAIRAEIETAQQQAQVPTTPEETIDFPRLNYRFRMPPSPWVRMEGKQINPLASLVVRRTQPEVFGMVIAEEAGYVDDDHDALAEVVIANLRSGASKVSVLSRKQREHGGLTGVRIVANAEVSAVNIPCRYCAWVTVQQGYCYQLIAWGPRKELAAVEAAADDLFARFSIRDPNKLATGLLPQEEFESERFGYRVPARPLPWTRWTDEDLVQHFPEAEVGVSYGQGGNAVVVPLSLMGQEHRLDALSAALLGSLDMSYPEPSLRRVRAVEGRGVVGQVLSGTFEAEGTTFEREVRLVRAEGRGLMLYAWWDRAQGGELASRMRGLLDAIEIEPGQASPGRGELHGRLRTAHAEHWERLGDRAFNEDPQRALRCYEEALVLEPSGARLAKQLSCLSQDASYHEALRRLERAPAALVRSPELLTWRGFLLAHLDRQREASAAYAQAFSGGYRSDEDMGAYLGLLWELERRREARQALQRYLAGGPAPDLVCQHALRLAEGEDGEEALRLLDALPPVVASETRVRVLQLMGDHARAVELCEQLIRQELASAQTYYDKGYSEYELRWYRRARVSLEKAKARATGPSESLDQMLRSLEGILGQGTRAGTSEAIEPVAFPAALLQVPPGSAKPETATYQLFLRGIEFQPGERLRITERYRVRIAAADEVPTFSSFAFDFHPDHERLYLNRLVVLGPDGRELAAGRPEDSYVLDRNGDAPSGRRTLHVPVAGLAPRRILELVLTREYLRPPREFPLETFCHALAYPIQRSALFLAAEPSSVVAAPSEGVTVRRLKGGLAYEVLSPPVYRSEPYAPHHLRYLPHVRVGPRGQSWAKVARDYRAGLKGLLAPGAEVKALAKELCQEAKSPADQVRALATHVRDTLHYKAVAFGVRGQIPRPVGEVLTNRYGDCKEHALLLYQLLRARGLPAELALVRVEGPLDPELPSLDAFDHMIVYLGGERPRFLDMTDKYYATDQGVPVGLAGRHALVLDPRRPRLVRLPGYPEGQPVRVQRRVKAEGEDLVLNELVTFHDYFAGYARGVFQGEPERQRSVLAGLFEGRVEVESLELSGVEDAEQPITLRARLRLRGALHRAAGLRVGRLPAPWLRDLFASAPLEDRRTPWRLLLARTLQVDVALSAPLELGDAPPAPQSSRFLSVEVRRWKGEQGPRLRVTASRSAGRHAAEDYAPFVGEVEAAMGQLETTVLTRAK